MALFYVVTFVKSGGKKKISKAERLKRLQEEEERREKEEGTKYTEILFSYADSTNDWLIFLYSSGYFLKELKKYLLFKGYPENSVNTHQSTSR